MFAALCVGALVFAACGGDDDDDDPATDTTEADDDASADAEPLKIGVVLVDYSAIADFVDFERGDQEAIAQAVIDDYNADGRVPYTLEAVFREYPPIPGSEPSPQAICTGMADDEEVFAVLGVFIDFTGEGQLCLTRDKETIHIGHELQDAWIDEAPPALLLTPGGTPEATAGNLIRLLGEEGMLEGKKVAVLGDDKSETRIDEVIVPGLEEIEADLGSTAVLTITGTDTSAAQSQLDGFIARWKEEGVDTIFTAGLTAPAKQFADKIALEMPGVVLIADSPSLSASAQDAVASGADPNPYEGLISLDGETRSERWAEPNAKLQNCIDAVEAAIGHEIVRPDDIVPNENGKNVEEFVAVEDFCDEVEMLVLGLEAAGAGVTNESWTTAIHGLGSIELPTATVASLCEGKYAANDMYRIVQFDPTIGENGDWKGVTELADASGGKCSGG
ncbi:MAG: hypothetical protein SGJ13_00475 [Actinomycetota bacterium]|nr:hypothetical protein [Actinomycetota bacterium]